MDDFFTVISIVAMFAALLLFAAINDSNELSNKKRLEQIRVHQTLGHYECNKLDVNTILCKRRK
jgi:YbbR domain-containing protein